MVYIAPHIICRWTAAPVVTQRLQRRGKRASTWFLLESARWYICVCDLRCSAYVSVYMYIYVYIYIYAYVCVYIYICMCVCVYVYIYIYLCVHVWKAAFLLVHHSSAVKPCGGPIVYVWG